METGTGAGLFSVNLGIEIGGTKLQLVIGETGGKIIDRAGFAVQPKQGAEGIRRQIEEGLRQLVGTKKLAAVGVGFGGPVNWKTGKIWCSHQIEGWSDFPLAKWLQDLSGAPVFVENDGNVAALGEARHGAGIGFNPVFYVTLGSGVGGGLVVDGEIYHGALPGEAEIGHIRLDRRGTTVESRCSGWAVDTQVRALAKKRPKGLLSQSIAGQRGAEARHLHAALRAGDHQANRVLEKISEDLAFGLSHVVHLFHPEVIIIGGGLSGLGEILRKNVAQALARFTMDAFRPGPKVAISGLGQNSVPIGALELAGQRRA